MDREGKIKTVRKLRSEIRKNKKLTSVNSELIEKIKNQILNYDKMNDLKKKYEKHKNSYDDLKKKYHDIMRRT